MINEEVSRGGDGQAAAKRVSEAGAGSEPLGKVIRYLRQQLGMTQEELAEGLGITVGTVSRWEKGRFKPSRLARALILEFARAHNVEVTLRSNGRLTL